MSGPARMRLASLADALARDAAEQRPHWDADRITREILPDLLKDVQDYAMGLKVNAVQQITRSAARAAIRARGAVAA